MISSTRTTTPSMPTSSSRPVAPKCSVESSRKSGTVITAATLETAVIVTESAVSPRARWVSMFAIVPPGEAPSRTRPTARAGSRSSNLGDPEGERRRDQRQIEHPDRDPARIGDHAPEVVDGQREPEADHDHGERDRQQHDREQRVLHRRSLRAPTRPDRDAVGRRWRSRQAASGFKVEALSAITDLFAGIPVSDLDAGVDWYTRFFGRPPDRRVGDEVLWEIDEHAWLFIEAERGPSGRGPHHPRRGRPRRAPPAPRR